MNSDNNLRKSGKEQNWCNSKSSQYLGAKLWMAFGFLLMCYSSCIEPFEAEIDQYEDLLVVDGRISTAPGPYEVRLSKASSIRKTEFLALRDATIEIVDDQGNSEVLKEVEDGVYQTDPNGIQGTVGNTYQLKISTGSANYKSAPEKLIAPLPIKKVYQEVSSQFSTEDPELAGFQFYVDSDMTGTDTDYFLWDLETTYKYNVDFEIPFVYSGAIVPFSRPDSFFTCWKTEPIKDIYTFDISNLSQPVLERLPLNFVGVDTRQLSIRYSLFVKQYSVSKEAFDFWSALQDQNDNQGSLYSSLPYQIRGNITNTSNADEPVLGYFMAAGVSDKRIYVDPFPGSFSYGICQHADPAAAQWDIRGLRWSRRSSWPIFLAQSPNGVLEVPLDECVDCRSVGGTIFKPSWWVE